jgi:predicted phosphodiesterase
MKSKIQFISDLHLEHNSKRIKPDILPDTDILVLAGDIHTKPESLPKFFRRIQKQKDIPIIYVMGNHEYYGHIFPDVRKEYYKACQEVENVYMLEKAVLFLNNIRFIGTALYSDLSNPLEAMAVQQGLTDFRTVTTQDERFTGYGSFTAMHWHQEYLQCREFIKNELLREYDDGPTVVVTHFAPSLKLIPDMFKSSNLNAGFYSNCEALIYAGMPDVWIYGHSHSDIDIEIGNTKVVANQAGYRHEGGKWKNKVIEV